MRWDERVFGREYDLDVFNIVAVSDFNMGAMENKGLNIFNDKYVLASPETATDHRLRQHRGDHRPRVFPQLDGQPGHLPRLVPALPQGRPDGLPRSGIFLRRALAPGAPHRRGEDACGPASSRRMQAPSPIRCGRRQYREINNFYTATVYEKGAEIVRMLKTIVGDDVFRRGMDLYFERCDGTAATVEDFLGAFAEVSGRDLSHFARWYAQAGTPRVSAQGRLR